jgi:hypothetical protein
VLKESSNPNKGRLPWYFRKEIVSHTQCSLRKKMIHDINLADVFLFVVVSKFNGIEATMIIYVVKGR